jgi:membrane protease YdiL (CAAX protease family)
MLTMLAVIALVNFLVRALIEGIAGQDPGSLPYNPAVVRIAGMVSSRFLEVVSVLLALGLLFRITRYGSFANLGLGRDKVRWLPFGFGAAVVALLLAALIAYVSGLLPVNRVLYPGPWPTVLALAAATHAAVVEEIAFRGVLLQGVERLAGRGRTGRWAAIIVSGLAFALLHVLAPFELSWAWWVLVLAAGIGFGWAFYAAGRALWLSIGLHWGFDLGVFLLLGLPGETRGWLNWPGSGPTPPLSSEAGYLILIGLALTAAFLLLVLRGRGIALSYE